MSKPDLTGREAADASAACRATVASTDEQARDEVPGLLEVLARVPDPRRKQGRRFLLVFILAVAVAAC